MAGMVAIVGGGASGALVATHLAQQVNPPRLVVMEPSAELGLGIAYATHSPSHLLNVRAGNMSAFPDAPDHFLDWLRGEDDPSADAGVFAPRMVYGRYLRSLVAGSGAVHCQQAAVGLKVEADAASVVLADGESVRAERVVLALGHFPPVDLPRISAEALSAGLYHRDPWRDFLLPSDRDAPVVLIGTGLTSVDMVLRLREQGHRGPVTMVSRHGLLSLGHAACEPCARPVVLEGTMPSARAYLKAFRDAVRDGVPWRAAIDSLRATSNTLWARLPAGEKMRFRRRLFHYWSVARHRMAPSIAEQVARERRSGHLVVRRGHVRDLVISGGAGRLTIVTSRGTESLVASCVINCTGPVTDYRRVESPLLRTLFLEGYAVAGDMEATLATDAHGALEDASGACSRVLYAIGPMRAGTLFETTAIPEIRQQARDLALHLTGMCS
ncbi:hydroxyacylglutathione hydrolase [Gluconacetobacter liquefaciens]|uniref:FAD-dependent oxidoreductase n=1 Tax=Gluconacetobacter liquefaciens TaxID=89584 RepID=A0A370G3J3_GLULI|nr:FAD/NAD(P)-binding protein [Gluconacetobacter liquefaciens]MBB2186656.1 FAD-dependent oxidoreductase [Gluconacetobacter liquefaciens]RDI38325.1 hydroxyacylglutathione hydrolase [Gluconacetobacter liquefaciens]GBR01865.1 hydroxyacylglutathione hydrolase [Gluconacetobacter liquefaciens NRIC 0522]GEB36616.1 hydroxyacylglutathione hydrolase [Gluconacetobacter liquefaciens]